MGIYIISRKKIVLKQTMQLASILVIIFPRSSGYLQN
jgi:hypothetical protein